MTECSKTGPFFFLHENVIDYYVVVLKLLAALCLTTLVCFILIYIPFFFAVYYCIICCFKDTTSWKTLITVSNGSYLIQPKQHASFYMHVHSLTDTVYIQSKGNLTPLCHSSVHRLCSIHPPCHSRCTAT